MKQTKGLFEKLLHIDKVIVAIRRRNNLNIIDIKHVKKRHPGIFEKYYQLIPSIISNPDYIGKNPTEPDSLELIKQVTDTLLVAVKLDPSGYLFLSSF